MTEQDWKNLLATLTLVSSGGKIAPVDLEAIVAFEKERRVALPSSYRAYCRVFGAGQLGNQFNIAVPGFAGQPQTFSVQYLTQSQIELADQYAALGVDVAQCKRGIFFGLDIIGAIHFFDPEDVADATKSEYAVYTLFRDAEVHRTADSFWQFVTEVCLGDMGDEVIASGDPPEQVFRPVGK